MKGAFAIAVTRSYRSSRLAQLVALALVAPGAAALGGCDEDSGAGTTTAAFREALPDEASLDITLPDDAVVTVSGGLSITEAALIGQPSLVRAHTARARKFLHDTIGELVESYQALVARRPTIKSADRAVWYATAAVAGVEHLVVMQRTNAHEFTMSGWVRDRRVDASAPWRFLALGELAPAGGGDGRGALFVDLDHDAKPRTKGQLVVLYAVRGEERQIDALAFGAATDEGDGVTRGFRFRALDGGGSLAFDAGLVDVHVRPDHTGPEAVRVITRWDDAGRFRGDFRAISEEVVGDGMRALVGSECWRAGDGTVLYELVQGLRERAAPIVLRDAGELSACPRPGAAVPVLPEPTRRPEEPAPPPEVDPLVDWGG